VAALLAYMNLDAQNYDTAEAQEALDAALEVQASLCVVEPYTQALAQACLRRAAAILTAKGAPLGQVDSGAFGTMPLIRYDAVTERLEADYRKGPLA
jgi:hypothetical protein